MAVYDNLGALFRVARAGSVEGDERFPLLAVDANRNIYLTAGFNGRTLIFGEGNAPRTLANRNEEGALGTFDSFLAQYAPNLDHRAVQYVTQPKRADGIAAMTTDANRHLHSVGGFAVATSFGTGNGAITVAPKTETFNVFVARYLPSTSTQATTVAVNDPADSTGVEPDAAAIAEMMALEEVITMQPLEDAEAPDPAVTNQVFLPLISQ